MNEGAGELSVSKTLFYFTGFGDGIFSMRIK